MIKEVSPIANAKGISLIELIIATMIVSIVATFVIPAYSSYRIRAHRLNAESCLLNLTRQQEAYFARHNQYVDDLKALGYTASSAADCSSTSQYRLTSERVNAEDCPLSRCYRISAVPQGTQATDGALYLTYDASQTDSRERLKKERGKPGSGQPWP